MFTLEELQKLDAKSLEEELKKSRLTITKLRLQHTSQELKETHKLKLYRKYVAKLQTMKTYLAREAPRKSPQPKT